MKSSLIRFFLLVAVVVTLVAVSGCGTDDPENVSVRPWDAPASWQNGLPIDNGQHR